MNFETATTSFVELVDTFSRQAGGSGKKELWFNFFDPGWLSGSWEMAVLLFIVAAMAVYSLTLGREKIVVFFVSAYLALGVVKSLPYLERISDLINANNWLPFAIPLSLIIFVLLFLLLAKSSLLSYLSGINGGFFQVILFSLLLTGLLFSVILSFLPAGLTSHLSFFSQLVFISDVGRFCWIILPILGLIFNSGRGPKLDLN